MSYGSMARVGQVLLSASSAEFVHSTGIPTNRVKVERVTLSPRTRPIEV